MKFDLRSKKVVVEALFMNQYNCSELVHLFSFLQFSIYNCVF